MQKDSYPIAMNPPRPVALDGCQRGNQPKETASYPSMADLNSALLNDDGMQRQQRQPPTTQEEVEERRGC